MREKETKTIDDVVYVCTMMPADVSNKTFVELVEMVGRPAMWLLAKAFDEEDKESLSSAFNQAMVILFQRLTPSSTDAITKALLIGVLAEGVKGPVLGAFNEHFKGRILHLHKVILWSIEVNYRDFFDAVLSSDMWGPLREVGMSAYNQLMSTLNSGDLLSPTPESTSETS